MIEKTQNYINGAWVDAQSSEIIEVMNPSDDSVMGVVAASTAEDVDLAVKAAKDCFQSFQFSTKEERITILENIIDERLDDASTFKFIINGSIDDPKIIRLN